MKRFVVESWLLLLYFEFMVLFRGFSQIHDVVRKQKTHPIPPNCQSSVEELCGAVDYACVFYFKEVLCLQRSAATTLLLRHHGIPAEMVIGAQVLPFRSHAWVELDGVVVNDKPYMLDIYRVLERC